MGAFINKYSAMENSFNANCENHNLTKKFIRAKHRNKKKMQASPIMDGLLGAICPLIPVYRFGGMQIHKINGNK